MLSKTQKQFRNDLLEINNFMVDKKVDKFNSELIAILVKNIHNSMNSIEIILNIYKTNYKKGGK